MSSIVQATNHFLLTQDVLTGFTVSEINGRITGRYLAGDVLIVLHSLNQSAIFTVKPRFKAGMQL